MGIYRLRENAHVNEQGWEWASKAQRWAVLAKRLGAMWSVLRIKGWDV